jgi:hypothetical protein
MPSMGTGQGGNQPHRHRRDRRRTAIWRLNFIECRPVVTVRHFRSRSHICVRSSRSDQNYHIVVLIFAPRLPSAEPSTAPPTTMPARNREELGRPSHTKGSSIEDLAIVGDPDPRRPAVLGSWIYVWNLFNLARIIATGMLDGEARLCNFHLDVTGRKAVIVSFDQSIDLELLKR